MVLIAPSLLSADSGRLGDEVQRLQQAKADLLHFDVMDGHFVPNMTFGSHVLRGLKKYTALSFDVHLMVNDPIRFIPWFSEAGADFITFHLETTKNPDQVIRQIKNYGIKAGITIKPHTDIQIFSDIQEFVDIVLIMGVEPGFGGQKFLSDTPERIYKARQIFNNKETLIEVDGGITPETAKCCITAGADILVAGTSVFKNGKFAENIQALRGE